MFENLSDKITEAFRSFRSKGKLTEADLKVGMRQIKLALLEADVNFKVVRAFVDRVRERALGEEILESLVPGQMIVKIVNEELCAIMGSENAKLQISPKPPTKVLMCGLQGSGKTTQSAKLARLYKKQGKRPLLVACDVYRPAAIRQLQIVGEQVEVPVFTVEGCTDPVKIASDALKYAERNALDFVIFDTAGRLQIDTVLMEELVRIKDATDPTEILLVVDSMTGQEAVNVAETFHEMLTITGVILTKLDGDTRGGAALSVKYVTGAPIKFVGMGEKLDQLEPFYPDRMANRILGMGDVLSLIEKAEAAIDQKKAAEMAEKLRENAFTLDDYLEQFRQIRSMGSMQDIMGMLPGIKPGDLKDAKIDEKQIDRMEAMILSMTPEERAKPQILNASRRRRIADGSGTSVEELNRFIRQFEQMQKMMKQFAGGGKKKGKLARKFAQFM